VATAGANLQQNGAYSVTLDGDILGHLL